MPQLRPTWQLSFATAGVLLVVYVVGALARRYRAVGEPGRAGRAGWAGWAGRAGRAGSTTVTAFAGEFAVIMALLGIWQSVGAAVRTRVAGAMERGRAIHAWEAAWHLPSERALQAAVDVVPTVVHAADVYYAYAHLNGMALFVGWLWWRHRDAYGRARGVIISSTLACLVVQTVPVAPPRLLPELGFVDTALRDGRSVYGAFGSGMANQLAAMPSVHVGWAVIVGWYVWRHGSRWGRWIGPLHALLTVLVVVVTANHWWLDGLVATGLVVLAELAISAGSSRSPRAERQRTCQACGTVLDRDVNAAVNLVRLAARGADSNGRGADQKTRSGGQVAVKRQPGARQRGRTGTLPSQGESSA